MYLTDARRRRRTGFRRPAEQPVPVYYTHRTSESSYSSGGGWATPSGERENYQRRLRRPEKQDRTRHQSVPDKSSAVYATRCHTANINGLGENARNASIWTELIK